jgi:hypothetical protein
MKPLSKIKIQWSPEFAYCIGLITSDGNLSKDGRHINFTSKDKQLIDIFVDSLKIKNKISMKGSGTIKEKNIFFVQFGDVNFYRFLQGIGLTPNKSKTLGQIQVPDKYFFDFLRGHFDGDGTFYSVFISASKEHILWLQEKIKRRLGIEGHITKSGSQVCYQLKYAKSDSHKLLPKIYSHGNNLCLSRKYLKIKNALAIIGERIK